MSLLGAKITVKTDHVNKVDAVFLEFDTTPTLSVVYMKSDGSIAYAPYSNVKFTHPYPVGVEVDLDEEFSKWICSRDYAITHKVHDLLVIKEAFIAGANL